MPEPPTIALEDSDAFARMVKDTSERITNLGEPVRGIQFVVSCPNGEWHVILSCMNEKGPTHWHLSAMLWPVGRGSETSDWESIGKILALVAFASGMKDRGDGKINGIYDLVNEQTAHPNLPRHWCWHADGGPCAVAAGMRKALALRDEMGADRVGPDPSLD
jgi:hypothetical protein